VYCVCQVVKTPTIISNNPVLVSVLKVSCLTSYNNLQYKRKLQNVYNNKTLISGLPDETRSRPTARNEYLINCLLRHCIRVRKTERWCTSLSLLFTASHVLMACKYQIYIFMFHHMALYTQDVWFFLIT
jgi:hypothetical protein